MITETAREYLRLCDQIATLKDQMSSAEDMKKKAEDRLSEEMNEEGVQRLSLDGRTIYQEKKWKGFKPKEVDMGALVEAFVLSGMEDMVTETINASRLDAWVREQAEALEEKNPGVPITQEMVVLTMPEALAGKVGAFIQYSIRNRKS